MPIPHHSWSAQGAEEVKESGTKKTDKGHAEFSQIRKVHFLPTRYVGNSEKFRTNLNIKFQYCKKPGGKPKFISVLLIYFFTLLGLGKIRSPQKGYSEAEMTGK